MNADDDYIESGPFCRHWDDPSDCQEKCARCGHDCDDHDIDDGDCLIDGCDCQQWVEDE